MLKQVKVQKGKCDDEIADQGKTIDYNWDVLNMREQE